ncbi:MAG: hypothetical protein JRH06_01290 [Deltaproteobacteria bacterium]|nr:hypothetical protein [Deltaproteobacteria bacterium]MBW2136174.1 hypothetical protein [Deltaproteobacteria bacterium]
MKEIDARIRLAFLAVSLIFLGACIAQQLSFDIQNSLPQSRLAYYNDPFDRLREDLWEKSGFVYSEDQLQNYESADMKIEKGHLIIETQVGTFSKGGLVAKYELKGDFDIQIDCAMTFVRGATDLDQVIGFAAIERGKRPQWNRMMAITILKAGQERSGIFASYRHGRTILGKSWHPTGDFKGSLRIVRIGDKVSTLYRRGNGRWIRTNTFPSSGNNAQVGLVLQNFTMKRKSIGAQAVVVGEFDNFRINAAQGIIEEEI